MNKVKEETSEQDLAKHKSGTFMPFFDTIENKTQKLSLIDVNEETRMSL